MEGDLTTYYITHDLDNGDDLIPSNETNVTYVTFTPYSLVHLLTTSVFLGLIILATIIGNVFVIAAILLEKNLQNIQNYLVLSLSVADLMVAALVMPLALLKDVSKAWFLGAEVCDMWISFDVICCTSSILHLVCIAVDRYWTVTRIDYVNNRSPKRILIMICLSWIVSVCISVPPLFGWKDKDHVPELTGNCLISQDWGYTVYSTVGAFYLPLICIMIIYLKIFQAAKSRIRKKHLKAYRDLASNMKPLIANSKLNTNAISVTKTSGVTSTTTNGSALHSSMDALSCSYEASSNGSVAQSNEDCHNNHNVSSLSITEKNRLSPPESPLISVAMQNNNKPAESITPPESPMVSVKSSHKTSLLDITRAYLEKTKIPSPGRRKNKVSDPKNKLEAKRERKAARTLAIITGTFVVCWLPFFTLATVRPFCGDKCPVDPLLASIIGWLGYFNSLLNPIIYTIFNPDFRMAFRKILFGQYKDRRLR